MGNPLKIQEFAQTMGLSASAVRFYEKAGLLPADQVVRNANGYREFSEQARSTLGEILRLKSLGLDLDQIRSIVVDDDYDCRTLRESLAEKIQESESVIETHRRRIESLRGLQRKCVEACDADDPTPCCRES